MSAAERAHTDEGYEERILDARTAAAEVADDDGEGPPPMTEEQGAAVGRLARSYRATDVVINYEPFDLPRRWILVQVSDADGRRTVGGIAPDGRSHT